MNDKDDLHCTVGFALKMLEILPSCYLTSCDACIMRNSAIMHLRVELELSNIRSYVLHNPTCSVLAVIGDSRYVSNKDWAPFVQFYLRMHQNCFHILH